MRDRIAIVDMNIKKFKVIPYKQYDKNNILRIVVTENGRLLNISNYTSVVNFKLPSGRVYEVPSEIKNNSVEVILTENLLKEYGKVIVEVEFSDEKQVVTTFSMFLNVEKSITDDGVQGGSSTTSHIHENMFVLNQITQDMINTLSNIRDIVWESIDLSNYVSKEELENKKYATENYVKNEIANVKLDVDNVDLSGYVTKDEMTEVNTRINKNTNDITKILGIIDEPPTYTKPTLSTTLSPSNIQHNVQTNITITPSFTKNDAGAVVSYSLSKNGVTLYSNSSISAYTDTITLQHGASVTYNAVVNYGDGIIKNTLLGIAYPNTSIKKGSISSSATVKCYALSYYGVINGNSIENVNGLSSVLRTSKGSTLTFNMSNQRVVYIYPKSFGNLTSIKDANNFDYINSYTLSNMTLDGVEYNVYILTDAVTISGFKQIFS